MRRARLLLASSAVTMKVNTFIQDKNSHLPIEVELTLVPGLPGIQFLGLPDQGIKESAVRIKTALRHCGYSFPQAQQVVVNLRPNNLRKSSRGLELAVAMAFLWESGQIPVRILPEGFYIYGELGLTGDVFESESIVPSPHLLRGELLTGRPLSNRSPFKRHIVRNLIDLLNPHFEVIEADHQFAGATPVRPTHFQNFLFSGSQADIVAAVAAGGHSLLIAGPAGSGKTTLSQAIHEFAEEPQEEDLRAIQRIHNDPSLQWKPLVKPHHLTPSRTLIGGGSAPYQGQIAQSHLGVLLLDEFLEFNSQVQEALREPFEEGRMKIYRQGKVLSYEFQAQILATTNLCPCGDFVPGKKTFTRCRFSLGKCRSYSQKLSGPLLDRFQVLSFSETVHKTEVPGIALLAKIQAAQKFRRHRGQAASNGQAPFAQIESSFRMERLKPLIPAMWPSQRRRAACLRLARTLADLDACLEVNEDHLTKALDWTLHNFEKLKRWDLD